MNNPPFLVGHERKRAELHLWACQVFTSVVYDMRRAAATAVANETDAAWETAAIKYDEVFDLLVRWKPKDASIN